LQANLAYLHKMITKNRRLAIILELVNIHSPNSQGKLLKLLHDRGFTITQTTLSRDIKQLKISKMPDDRGNYIYTVPRSEASHSNRISVKEKTGHVSNRGFISIDFSCQLCVIRTRPGYASGMAADIESHIFSFILGVITGDDTILLVIREGISRQEVLNKLASIIPGMKKNDGETALVETK